MKRLLVILWMLPCLAFAADTLDIYWIDVEGGAATLIITPGGETILMDAGWPGFDGRDARRIKKVLSEEAQAQKIDFFITSHFHRDHVGGLPQLAEVVPVGKFVDHGDSVEQDRERGLQLWKDYLRLAEGKRMPVKPGDKLPLTGAELIFVAAHSKFINEPLGGSRRANAFCAGATLKQEDKGENGKSTGFLVRMGKFEFLDLGDLTWSFEHELVCPENLLGEIDLYQTTHHGMDSSNPPQLVAAIQPTVAVMNNGPRKGGSPAVYEILKSSEGFRDLWQGHLVLETDATHNTDRKLIANLGETENCQGHWIKASVRQDGSYTVTNSRNGFSKSYQAK